MNELDIFFKEQEERMAASEEDIEDYLTRLSEEKQRRKRFRARQGDEIHASNEMQAPKRAKTDDFISHHSHEEIHETMHHALARSNLSSIPTGHAMEEAARDDSIQFNESRERQHVVLSEALSNKSHKKGSDSGYNEGPFLANRGEYVARNKFATRPESDLLLIENRQHEHLGIADQIDSDASAEITANTSSQIVTSERARRSSGLSPLSLKPPKAVSGNSERSSTSLEDSLKDIPEHKRPNQCDQRLRGLSTEYSNLAEITSITTPADSVQNHVPHRAKKAKEHPHTAAKSERQLIKEEKAKRDAVLLARKQEEALEKLMTPTEYAQKLQTKFASLLAKTPAEKLFLKDKHIFYVGGDHGRASQTTRSRMDFIRRKGGVVAPTFDPSLVTHVVTEAGEEPTLKALRLKSLAEVPNHIPTVVWSWITSGNSGRLDDESLHAVFTSRRDANCSKAPKKTDKRTSKKTAQRPARDWEFSRIEEFPSGPNYGSSSKVTIEDINSKAPLPAPIASNSEIPAKAGNSAKEDPLAEFYAQAARDQETLWPYYEESEDGEDQDDDVESDVEAPPPPSKKRGFTCDNKGPVVNGPCFNQDIVDKLQELMELHEAKPSEDDKWRVFSYGKAIRALRNYPKRIKSFSEARTIRGIGDKTAKKIMEIVKTGKLDRIEYERTMDVEVTKIFKGIYGVGPHIAHQWYASGCRTIEDVIARKGGIYVSPVQEIGIKFYDDINLRMPRSEAGEIFEQIKAIALQIDSDLFIEIMGSYRRGKETCGDIDILITRPCNDGKTHAGVLRRLIRELHLHNILTEDLALPDDFNSLEATYRGLCRKDADSPRRRIDILTVPYISRGGALMYYTGDDIFNRAIRYKAGQMGYSLNQRGLYAAVIRDPKDRKRKLNKGHIVASETEEEIFRILGVPWQEPHERVRNI